MGAARAQLLLLMWKCYVTIIKHNKLSFVAELLAPGALAFSLVYARSHIDYSTVDNVTTFEPFPIDRLPLRYRQNPPSAPRWILLFAPDTEPVSSILKSVAEGTVPQLEGNSTFVFASCDFAVALVNSALATAE